MSTTVTMTTTASAAAAVAPGKPALQLSTAPCCPKCGFSLHLPPVDETQTALLEAQKQIADLQAQVRLLNQKAASAVDRWADYEDELAKLRRQVQQQQQQQSSASSLSPSPPTPPLPSSPPARSSFLSTTAANRISALLSPRKSTPNLKSPPPASSPAPPLPPPPPSSFPPFSPPPSAALTAPTPFSPPFSPIPPHFHSLSALASPTPSTDDLLEALSREQHLRLEAEGKLSDTSREVEELSVQLFEQANEMVASERRARARLEERVEVLERRDVDKRHRLERLESAMGRIERVRAMLAPPPSSASAAAVPDGKKPADVAKPGLAA